LKSCLLLAGLAAKTSLVLVEPGPSRDHSERMLSSMGASITSYRDEDGNVVVNMEPIEGRSLSPLHINLPGDFSAAAFLIVAGLITPGADLIIQGVGLNPTRTGLLDVLIEMGADIKIQFCGDQAGEPVGNLHIRHCVLRGTEISGDVVVRMIDEFPILAVAAVYAQGVTRVTEAQELRFKESDRIKAMVQQFHAVGIQIKELKDGFEIVGGTIPASGVIDPRGDHRIAMSFAVAGLASAGPIEIVNAEIMDESFPRFMEVLQLLGANIETRD